jgi:phytoene/squalene synthetase
MINLERNYKRVRDRTFTEMIRGERRRKYQFFLTGLRSLKYISRTRGNILESYYVFMRQIDDVADRDIPHPFPEEFIERKIEFAKNPAKPLDELDQVLTYCYDRCDSLGIDLKQETNDLLSSMLFDARRYGKMQVFPEAELFHHFDLLDIRGCEKACLKLYDEDPNKLNIVMPLGLASRIYYNLRDFQEDTGKGLVNITEEDMTRLGLCVGYLQDPNNSKVREWFREQSRKGLDLIREHRRVICDGDFGLVARLTFPLIYERPAKKYFEGVLNY